jgi:serralysin
MQSVTIPVTADMINNEANETFNIRLTNLPANSTLVGTGSVQGTIVGQVIDDYANAFGSAAPYGVLSTTAPAAGSIEQYGDIDWFQINATAGSYTFDATGTTLSDTVLMLYDGSGNQIAYNDDAGGTYNSRIDYTLAAGTYYAAVRGFGGGTGDYTLSMQSAAAANSNASITAFSPVQSEGGIGVVTSYMFQVSRSSAVGAASVAWTVAGNGLNPANLVAQLNDPADFAGPLSGTVNFADGVTQAYVTVDVQGDIGVEANENFEVTLSNGVGVISIRPSPKSSQRSTMTMLA